MLRIHPLFLLSALPLIACGGSDGDEDITPEGPHHTYVASQVTVPTSQTQGRDFSFDVDGNGTLDNQLASTLNLLKAMAQIDAQVTVTGAVDQGDIILLVDVQTSSFDSSRAAGFQIKFGDKATAQPTPCTDASDAACRKHLAGNGQFTVAASSPTNAALGGEITGGVFEGGPGNLSLQLTLSSSAPPFRVDLAAAQAKVTGISDNGITSIVIGGAVTKQSIDNEIIPAIGGLLEAQTNTCSVNPDTTQGQPRCICTDPEDSVIDLLDNMPADCRITTAELAANPLLPILLATDVVVDGQPALSVGVGATAVKASFPAP